MIIDFKNSNFETTYSFESARAIVRPLSDAFSKQNCDTKEAIKYAAAGTQGNCIYCGEKMYKLKNGVPSFNNSIHYDHVYPASKLNLFEVGNVALACENCNLSKSDKFPLEYYDMRVAEGLNVFIEPREEFELFLNKFTTPYKEKWPEHYEAGTKDFEDDDEFKKALARLLFNHVDISRTTGKYNHEKSINREIWKKVSTKVYELYSEYSAKDVIARLGYTNHMFEEIYDSSTLINELDPSQLSKFFNQLLLSKSESKNEIQKYRMLIRVLIEVLKEDLDNLNDLFDTLPTYKML